MKKLYIIPALIGTLALSIPFRIIVFNYQATDRQQGWSGALLMMTIFLTIIITDSNENQSP